MEDVSKYFKVGFQGSSCPFQGSPSPLSSSVIRTIMLQCIRSPEYPLYHMSHEGGSEVSRKSIQHLSRPWNENKKRAICQKRKSQGINHVCRIIGHGDNANIGTKFMENQSNPSNDKVDLLTERPTQPSLELCCYITEQIQHVCLCCDAGCCFL